MNNVNLGKIDLYAIDHNDIDKVMGDRIYLARESKVAKDTVSHIVQFALETSNVDVEQTLCHMLFLLELRCIKDWEPKLELVKILLMSQCSKGAGNRDALLPFLALTY